jgi:hypothetical protein
VAGVTRRLIILALAATVTACEGDLRATIERFTGIVDEGVTYVDGTCGNDGNPGSKDQPKQSITAAIELAEALGGSWSVNVAEGTYLLRESLRVVEGISVRGGYASRSWQRDIEGHPTRFQAVAIETAIKPDEGVTSQTMLEGVFVIAASRDIASCIWCDGCSPTISKCILDANAASETSIGIYATDASPVIEACTIFSGAGSDEAWGIVNVRSDSTIRNCVIVAESETGLYTGISCTSGSDAFIQNNTVWAGDGEDDAAVYLSASHGSIDNNIFFTSDSGCGIYEHGTDALPARVWHNDFWCSSAYCMDGSAHDLAWMIARFDANDVDHRNNGSVDPGFVDPDSDDYHLAGASPIVGCDLSAVFSEDRDGVARTVPWSVGAYEKD